MSLLIVIINYRTPQLTLDCLASLAPQIDDVPDTHVVLIDNGSGDDSVERLAEHIERNGWEWITLIAADDNHGFAAGNNLGLSTLLDRPEDQYVLLLNSDTLVQPGVLRHCFDVMEADPSIAVMSCLLLNPDGTPQNAARRFPNPLRLAAASFGLPWQLPSLFSWADPDDPTWDRRTTTRDVDWVGGAFMFIRRKVIDRIGGLDERFFFYGEDTEFCHRATRRGWNVRYDPSVAVVHLGGASSDPTRLPARQRNALQWQARYLVQRRCYGPAAEVFIRAVDIASFSLRYLKLIVRGRRNTPEYANHRDVLAMLLRGPSGRAVAEKG
jgi:N-acetylglucosaminyl-diphospho-decaprenol L-rhamnosyltransferase